MQEPRVSYCYQEDSKVSGALLGLCARTIILLDGACLAVRLLNVWQKNIQGAS